MTHYRIKEGVTIHRNGRRFGSGEYISECEVTQSDLAELRKCGHIVLDVTEKSISDSDEVIQPVKEKRR